MRVFCVKVFPVDFEVRPHPTSRPGHRDASGVWPISSTRRRKPWNGKDRSPAEPLGIAADARWIWHEIGHVLLTTSVGELEFRFAHSPGDALAAIVSDPRSALATDPNWRGATFPWVFCHVDTTDAYAQRLDMERGIALRLIPSARFRWAPSQRLLE